MPSSSRILVLDCPPLANTLQPKGEWAFWIWLYPASARQPLEVTKPPAAAWSIRPKALLSITTRPPPQLSEAAYAKGIGSRENFSSTVICKVEPETVASDRLNSWVFSSSASSFFLSKDAESVPLNFSSISCITAGFVRLSPSILISVIVSPQAESAGSRKRRAAR